MRQSRPVEHAILSGNTHDWRTITAEINCISGLPAGCHMGLVTSLSELSALEKPWRLLEANTRTAASVFQSYDWINTWCSIYASGDTRRELLVITGFQDQKLVFAFPLMMSNLGGLNVLGWLTEPAGQYGDILLDKTHLAQPWLHASLELIRRFKGIDLLWLRHMRSDSATCDFAAANFACARHIERAPFLDLSLFGSQSAYDARYTSAQRKRRKKIRKSLEENGPLTFETLPPGTMTDAAITKAIGEKNKWLAGRGRINRILKCPLHLEFMKRLSRMRGNGFEFVTTELKSGDTPVSWELGFRYNGTHFAYITAHDNRLTEHSPGRLHMDFSQRKAIDDGLSRFDLMVPNDPHKESWSSGAVETRDMYYPLSFKGHAYGWIYLQKLRPLVRTVYYRLPPRLLHMLSRVFGF